MNFSTRSLRLVLLIGTALSLFWIFDWWPLLRGPQQWRWALAPTPPATRLLLFIAAVALFVASWWLLGRWLTAVTTPRRIRWSLLSLIILSLLVQTAMLALVRPNPAAIQFERLASNQASGYFTVAQEIEHLPTFLRQFPELMPNFSPDPHPRSKPPGIVLLYWGIERLLAPFPSLSHALGNWARGIRCGDLWLASLPDLALAANALMGILTPIVSALIILPAYQLAANWRGPRAGGLAAGLVALMPGRLMFAPHLDTVYPLLTLLALWLTERGWQRQRPYLTYTAGLVLALMTFFSLVNGLSAIVVGLFLVVRAGLVDESFTARLRRFWPHAIALVGGTVTLWAIYWLGSGVTPLDIYRAAAPARHDLARSYWLWLAGNLYDLAIFAGLPAFLLALPSLTDFSTTARRRRPYLLALSIAFWATLLLLDLSGMIRGEVGRIWLMLAPLPALLAAIKLTDKRQRVFRLPVPLAVVLVTAVTTTIMGARWEVTQLEWPVPEQREIVMTAPPITRPKTAVFGTTIELLGYDLQQNENWLDLTLYWQALARPNLPYTIFIHVTDANGTLVVQQDGMPQNGRLPTTCWQRGEIISDAHRLELPADASGDYDILLGLYSAQDGSRLPVDAPNDALSLTAVTIEK